MQQIPRKLKLMIYGRPKGRAVLKADYPGIEARVMAIVARDQVLIKLFREGGDMHVNTGKYVLGMTKEEVNKNPDSRYKVKSINFGMIFGMGAKNFVKYAYTSFGINIELDEAERIKQKFFEVYRGIKALHDLHGRLLREQPFIIMQTILGRRMRVDRFTNANNYPVQGSAADMLKLACVLFFNKCRKQKLDACIINYVHDELVVETSRAHAAKARIALKESMEQAADYVIQLFHTDVEVEEIK